MVVQTLDNRAVSEQCWVKESCARARRRLQLHRPFVVVVDVDLEESPWSRL
jgi:hypothetical protein